MGGGGMGGRGDGGPTTICSDSRFSNFIAIH